jgi:hypothetical protein
MACVLFASPPINPSSVAETELITRVDRVAAVAELDSITPSVSAHNRESMCSGEHANEIVNHSMSKRRCPDCLADASHPPWQRLHELQLAWNVAVMPPVFWALQACITLAAVLGE